MPGSPGWLDGLHRSPCPPLARAPRRLAGEEMRLAGLLERDAGPVEIRTGGRGAFSRAASATPAPALARNGSAPEAVGAAAENGAGTRARSSGASATGATEAAMDAIGERWCASARARRRISISFLKRSSGDPSPVYGTR